MSGKRNDGSRSIESREARVVAPSQENDVDTASPHYGKRPEAPPPEDIDSPALDFEPERVPRPEKNQKYPPIITIDGRVDTDIDHLMDDLEEDKAVVSSQHRYPKPHVFSVIEGSIDDDVDSLANHDGTMEHTLVDAPKTFNSRDLKDVAAKATGTTPPSRASRPGIPSDRSHNKQHIDVSEDEDDFSRADDTPITPASSALACVEQTYHTDGTRSQSDRSGADEFGSASKESVKLNVKTSSTISKRNSESDSISSSGTNHGSKPLDFHHEFPPPPLEYLSNKSTPDGAREGNPLHLDPAIVGRCNACPLSGQRVGYYSTSQGDSPFNDKAMLSELAETVMTERSPKSKRKAMSVGEPEFAEMIGVVQKKTTRSLSNNDGVFHDFGDYSPYSEGKLGVRSLWDDQYGGRKPRVGDSEYRSEFMLRELMSSSQTQSQTQSQSQSQTQSQPQNQNEYESKNKSGNTEIRTQSEASLYSSSDQKRSDVEEKTEDKKSADVSNGSNAAALGASSSQNSDHKDGMLSLKKQAMALDDMPKQPLTAMPDGENVKNMDDPPDALKKAEDWLERVKRMISDDGFGLQPGESDDGNGKQSIHAQADSSVYNEDTLSGKRMYTSLASDSNSPKVCSLRFDSCPTIIHTERPPGCTCRSGTKELCYACRKKGRGRKCTSVRDSPREIRKKDWMLSAPTEIKYQVDGPQGPENASTTSPTSSIAFICDDEDNAFQDISLWKQSTTEKVSKVTTGNLDDTACMSDDCSKPLEQHLAEVSKHPRSSTIRGSLKAAIKVAEQSMSAAAKVAQALSLVIEATRVSRSLSRSPSLAERAGEKSRSLSRSRCSQTSLSSLLGSVRKPSRQTASAYETLPEKSNEDQISEPHRDCQSYVTPREKLKPPGRAPKHGSRHRSASLNSRSSRSPSEHMRRERHVALTSGVHRRHHKSEHRGRNHGHSAYYSENQREARKGEPGESFKHKKSYSKDLGDVSRHRHHHYRDALADREMDEKRGHRTSGSRYVHNSKYHKERSESREHRSAHGTKRSKSREHLSAYDKERNRSHERRSAYDKGRNGPREHISARCKERSKSRDLRKDRKETSHRYRSGSRGSQEAKKHKQPSSDFKGGRNETKPRSRHRGPTEREKIMEWSQGDWSLPAVEPALSPKQEYFSQVVKGMKDCSVPTEKEAHVSSSDKYIRSKLVGSGVDPDARDSEYDSIEFNANARVSDLIRKYSCSPMDGEEEEGRRNLQDGVVEKSSKNLRNNELWRERHSWRNCGFESSELDEWSLRSCHSGASRRSEDLQGWAGHQEDKDSQPNSTTDNGPPVLKRSAYEQESCEDVRELDSASTSCPTESRNVKFSLRAESPDSRDNSVTSTATLGSYSAASAQSRSSGKNSVNLNNGNSNSNSNSMSKNGNSVNNIYFNFSKLKSCLKVPLLESGCKYCKRNHQPPRSR